MGISVLKRVLVPLIAICFAAVCHSVDARGADTAGIDDDTVITVDQAGSIAASVGDYGWDSRGAIVDYCSVRGDISGTLGEVMFTDESGIRRPFLWDEWGGVFPDRWGRLLAERLRASLPESEISAMRSALSDSLIFSCTWEIVIGTKSSKAGGKLYKTLRQDNTLRVAFGKNLDLETVPERLFTGDEMENSLQYILPHEKWGSASLETFAERNPYIYTVQINSYDIDVRATNCTRCAAKGLPGGSTACTHVEAGTYFNERLPISYDGKMYYDDRSFAWEGQTVTIEERAYPGYIRSPKGDDITGVVGELYGNRLTPSGDTRIILCYEKEEHTVPNPEPEPEPEPEPGLGEPVITEHSSDSAFGITDPLAAASIRSDSFDVSVAIPSTEPVYVYAAARDYLYTLEASVISGQWGMNVNVEFPYELVWEEDGNEVSESGSVMKTVTVTRPYSYVHLSSFAYYTLESITVGNRALTPSRVVLTPQMLGVTMPYCSQPVSHGGKTPAIGANVKLPKGFSDSITAQVMRVVSEDGKPEVPVFTYEEANAIAEAATGEMQCRNDELVFGGVSVTGGSGWHDYRGTESINTGAFGPTRLTFDTRNLYGTNYMSVPAGNRNTITVTDARILKYTPVIRYGDAVINYNPLLAVNSVAVHTPVICSLIIGESSNGSTYGSNLDYNQEAYPCDPDVFQLVVGASTSYGINGSENDSCDFTLEVSNRGRHGVYSGRLGSNHNYFNNISGINGARYTATNEVRFPFDVCLDVAGDRKTGNDIMIRAGEWFDMGASRYRFYIREFVPEGDYVIEARTRAVNSYSREDMTGAGYKNGKLYLPVNSSTYDYVAADSVKVHVSGKMSGIRLCGISSKAEWGDVLLAGRTEQEARAGTVSDGTLIGVLPTGRARSAELKTLYFYYTAGTKNEMGTDTGRHERFVLPLLDGSHPDSTKQNIGMLKAGYTWTFELDTTGTLMASEKAFLKITPVFEWISEDLKTREAAQLHYRSKYLDNGREEFRVGSSGRSFTGATGNSIYRQTWRFTYSLPSSPVIKTGDTVRTDGYLVVGFRIVACDGEGREYLNYASEKCNMWKTEGQQPVRTDYYGRSFDIRYGDVIIVNLNKNKGSDYITDHRY